ncbi:MAG TPA: hypothetical protein VD993_14180 [Chitinophagaceae bacterium]|nr:hypothetical protein [Chitinophagaceae bacterium]
MKYPVRYIFASCLLAVVFLSQCKKEEVPIPVCIQQKIDSIKLAPRSTPPVQVHAWLYRGIKVYLVSAPDTTQFVRLYDETCNFICAPSGGPTGIGDSTCTDFYQEAQHLSLIWQDQR